MEIRQLTALERRRTWGSQKGGGDARVLWAGCYREARARLARRSSVVVGAIAALEDMNVENGTARSELPVSSGCESYARLREDYILVVSRALFLQSGINDRLWSYGYLWTDFRYRRRGLALQVLREGLRIIQGMGGHHCSCFVAQGNQSSVDLAKKLGFIRLGFVRLVFAGAVRSEVPIEEGSAQIVLVECSTQCSVSSNLPARLLESFGVGAELVVEGLTVGRSLIPWRRNMSRIVKLVYCDRILGLARIESFSITLALRLRRVGNDG